MSERITYILNPVLARSGFKCVKESFGKHNFYFLKHIESGKAASLETSERKAYCNFRKKAIEAKLFLDCVKKFRGLVITPRTKEAVKLEKKYEALKEQAAIKRVNRKLSKANVRERVSLVPHSSPKPARFVLATPGCYEVAGWDDIHSMECGVNTFIKRQNTGMIIKSQ